MIVDEDQRGRIECEAALQDLPRIDRNMIDRADGEAFVREEPVPSVQIEGMEPLDFAADGDRT